MLCSRLTSCRGWCMSAGQHGQGKGQRAGFSFAGPGLWLGRAGLPPASQSSRAGCKCATWLDPRCGQRDWGKGFCLSAGHLGTGGAIARALYFLGDGAGCHVALEYVTAEVPAVQEVLVRVFQASLPAAISGGTTGSAIMSKLAGRRGTLSLQVLLCCAASAENLTCDA